MCLAQSAPEGHWQLIQGDPFPDSVTQIVNMLTISSSDEIQSAGMIDVMGRSLIEIAPSHSTTLSASVASIPSGFYFVKAETAGGTIVRKVMIVR